jgi:uncharacterized membrane protein YhaH (DUF805 family)
MGFPDAIATCFRKYASVSGRASRPEYWWFFLFVFLADTTANMADGLIFGFDTDGNLTRHPITLVVGLGTLLPALAAGWRRMQDTGRPGWFVVLPTLIALGGMVGVMVGVAGFSLLHAIGANPETLRGIASVLGVTGLAAVYLAVLVAGLLKLWWLTRPGTPSANAYGPVPA